MELGTDDSVRRCIDLLSPCFSRGTKGAQSSNLLKLSLAFPCPAPYIVGLNQRTFVLLARVILVIVYYVFMEE